MSPLFISVDGRISSHNPETANARAVQSHGLNLRRNSGTNTTYNAVMKAELEAVVYRRPTVWVAYPINRKIEAIPAIRSVAVSLRMVRLRQSNTTTTASVPNRNRRNRNENGRTWSRASFVAGKVAAQRMVVARRASWGMA